MINEFFRVKSVDMNGYNGREHHPSLADIGLVVRPIEMSVFVYRDPEQSGVPEPIAEDLLKQQKVEDRMLPHLFDNDDTLETLFTCVAPDGRILDFMDFEVESIDKSYALYLLGKSADPRD